MHRLICDDLCVTRFPVLFCCCLLFFCGSLKKKKNLPYTFTYYNTDHFIVTLYESFLCFTLHMKTP